MARHTTHKASVQGRRRTLAHRANRAAKRNSAPLDVEALRRELVSSR